MALIGSYGTGSIISYEYSTVDDLLNKLLDNSSYLIDPVDIRDPVYTLWKRIDDVSLVAASAASASALFTNLSPSTVTVGGLTQGSTFSNILVSDLFQQMLYPYTLPEPSLSIFGSTQAEFGDPVKLSSITLAWDAGKGSDDLQSITVDTISFFTGGPPWTSNVGGFQSRPGYHPSSPGVEHIQLFTMSVSDGTNTVVGTTSFSWKNRVYWGTVNLSSIGNPNLYYYPGSASMVSSLVTDSVIENLNNQLSISKDNTYENLGPTGGYILFAWPSSVSGSAEPKFEVNGQVNTAFTRLRNGLPYTNQHGFTTNYEVWISNTIQYSTLNVKIS